MASGPHQEHFRGQGRLFRWDDTSSKWTSLGSGSVVVTENPTNGTRKLMFRRNRKGKDIVLYHAIDPEWPLNATHAQREWTFKAPKYLSNGEVSEEPYTFGLRLETEEMSQGFKKAYDESREHMQSIEGRKGQIPQAASPMHMPKIPEGSEEVEEEHSREFQKFLDSNQYTLAGVLKYEKVFGHGYVSTGGYETTKAFLPLMYLNKGEHVLDLGCGVGGGDFEMARKYKVSVLGIDLSANMLKVAADRATEAHASGEKIDVEFKELDATTANFEDESFDVIYSRDTILHIEDKMDMFRKCYRWLRPGGRILISDYCRGNDSDEEFRKYVEQRGYHLLTVPQYGRVLAEAGFKAVDARNVTDMFTESLRRELNKTEGLRDQYIRDFGEEGFKSITDGWKRKLQRCDKGYQQWGLFIGYKPPVSSKTHWDIPDSELPGRREFVKHPNAIRPVQSLLHNEETRQYIIGGGVIAGLGLLALAVSLSKDERGNRRGLVGGFQHLGRSVVRLFGSSA